MDDTANPVRRGTLPNGQKYIRVDHSDTGIVCTVNGTGDTDSNAISDLQYRLRALAEWAEDAASSMDV